ncbi:MAG: hypothetical protein WBM13_10810 [Bacteroidia bacterium]
MYNGKKIGLFLMIFMSFLVLIYFAPKNEFCEGGADNFWHYYFSKYSYSYPEFFLHHWGKPIFILLSAPFAQFGFIGIEIFNIICGLASAYVCYRFCCDLGLKYSWLVIPIVIFSPLYFVMLQSAMTEPLFGLLIILSSYLLFKKQFLIGAIVASFLIFSRSEGIFIVVYYAFYLMLFKQWKYIPTLLTAFFIYGFVGYFAGHSFLWYFTEMPYAVESPYGQGTWFHFFRFYKNIWGEPHLILLVVGIAILLFNIIRNKELNIFKHTGSSMQVILLVFIPALLFTFFHIISWRFGLFASAGLERVFACTIPCSAIVCMYTVNQFSNLKIPNYATKIIIAVCFLFVVGYPFNLYQFPRKAVADEKVERAAAEWFKVNGKNNYTIYYAHPAIVFYADLNPFDKVKNKECFEYYKDCTIEKDKPFYYFWDSAFSEFSCKTTKQELESCAGMKLVKQFKEDGFELCIYEFTPL